MVRLLRLVVYNCSMANRASVLLCVYASVAAVAIAIGNGCGKSESAGKMSQGNPSAPNLAATSATSSTSPATTIPSTQATADTEPQPNGWGAVTFDMTEAEVRTAYPSAVPINPPEEYDRAAAWATLQLPDIRAAGLEFVARFLFNKNTHRLSMVLLRRDAEKPSEYEQVLAALTEKYGPPLRSKDLSTASVDSSSPEQEAKTRIGSGSATWIVSKTRVSAEYFEALGTRYLLVSYKAKSEEPNL
jgi:hypothetical protein